jgi:hypothetical protein
MGKMIPHFLRVRENIMANDYIYSTGFTFKCELISRRIIVSKLVSIIKLSESQEAPY